MLKLFLATETTFRTIYRLDLELDDYLDIIIYLWLHLVLFV